MPGSASDHPFSPPSLVRACGALGRFDRELLLRIARALDPAPRIVHQDEECALALDREPIRWGSADARGLAWTELVAAPLSGDWTSWEDAATAGACCGLTIAAGGPALHSSVSGVAPLYYREIGGAVYFATTVHALAVANDERLSVDWDAWASILHLNYPLADRTPFAEIRRLGPCELLRCSDGRTRLSVQAWPWEQVEPRLTVEEGLSELIAGMRAAVARIPAGPVVCPLTAGWDSRICLALLLERPELDVRTITTIPDAATDREPRAARVIAEAAGVPHEVVVGDPADWWDDLAGFAERVDFQVVRLPWRMVLLEPLRERRAPVVDGLAFDVFAAAGDRFFTGESIATHGGDAVVEALWTSFVDKAARRVPPLRPALLRALEASTRRQLMATSERFRGHPQRSLMTYYLSRHMRGISQVPVEVLGADVPMSLPFMEDRFVRSNLAITFAAKQDARLYRAVFAALRPDLGALPSNRFGAELPGDPVPVRSQTAAAADALARCLAEGPLAPYLAPRALRSLARHRRGRPPRVDAALLAPAVFHLWHRRYRDRLGDDDPAAALGVSVRGRAAAERRGSTD